MYLICSKYKLIEIIREDFCVGNSIKMWKIKACNLIATWNLISYQVYIPNKIDKSKYLS